MVASSSRWNPYWLLVALCSATRERADRMRAPVSVAIILLQTAASRINSLFASKARQCYIVHCVEHQRNHRDAMPVQRPDGIDSRVRSAANRCLRERIKLSRKSGSGKLGAGNARSLSEVPGG